MPGTKAASTRNSTSTRNTAAKRTPAITRKTKTEAVMSHPGVKPVKSTASARGGLKNPSAVMTGGGKVKSASSTKDAMLKSKPVGNSGNKLKAAASHPRTTAKAGSSLGTKMGMAKSSQMKEPRIATATKSPSARAKPQSVANRGVRKIRPAGAATTNKTGAGSRKMSPKTTSTGAGTKSKSMSATSTSKTTNGRGTGRAPSPVTKSATGSRGSAYKTASSRSMKDAGGVRGTSSKGRSAVMKTKSR